MLQKQLFLRGSVLVCYVFLVIVNIWAGVAGTNTTISNEFEVPLTPSGYAFSIWGVIFLFQGIWTVWICLPSNYDEPGSQTAKGAVLDALAVPICLVWIFQCLWQFSFAVRGFVISTVFILSAYIFAMWGLFRLFNAAEEIAKHDKTYSIFDMPAFWSTAMNAAWLSAASSIGILIQAKAAGADDAALAPFVFVLPSILAVIAIIMAVWKHNSIYSLVIYGQLELSKTSKQITTVFSNLVVSS